MDAYKFTSDLVGSLAWPVAVVLLALLFGIRFRAEIAAMLRYREINVKTPVGDLNLPAQQAKVADVAELASLIPVETHLEALKTASQDVEEARNQAAQWAAVYRYEVAYRMIYGSQIELLRHLNALPLGATADQLDQFYQWFLARTRAASSLYPRDAYLNFLVQQNLVQNVNGNFVISNDGVGFLYYMTNAHLPEKPY